MYLAFFAFVFVFWVPHHELNQNNMLWFCILQKTCLNSAKWTRIKIIKRLVKQLHLVRNPQASSIADPTAAPHTSSQLVSQRRGGSWPEGGQRMVFKTLGRFCCQDARQNCNIWEVYVWCHSIHLYSSSTCWGSRPLTHEAPNAIRLPSGHAKLYAVLHLPELNMWLSWEWFQNC